MTLSSVCRLASGRLGAKADGQLDSSQTETQLSGLEDYTVFLGMLHIFLPAGRARTVAHRQILAPHPQLPWGGRLAFVP